MGVPIDMWVETIKKHPAKYRFRGLSGDYRTGAYFTDVREAAIHDERFMERWMGDERKSLVEELEYELRMEPPAAGGEDQPNVESYAQFLRCRRWREWDEPGNVNHAPARSIIEKLEPKESIGVGYGRRMDADDFRFEWSLESAEPDWAWETIRAQEPDHLLEEHPPEAMWSHAYEQGVDMGDVLFVCPGCNREPIRDGNVDRDPVKFYCGLCGASACPDEGQTLEEWAEAVGVRLWPFKEEG